MFYKALRFSLRSEHAASREGFCNGDAGSVADPPRWVGGQRTRIGKNLSKKYALSVANAPKRSQGRFFGDLVVDLDVKASRRRYGAERADPRRRTLQVRRGHASSVKKRHANAVRGGRDAQPKKGYFESPN